MQIEVLSKAPKLASCIGNQTKLLRGLVYLIFDKAFFSNYTWSGKTIKGKTKTAIQKYDEILDTLLQTVQTMDKSYTVANFLSNLKDKIIKHAYK